MYQGAGTRNDFVPLYLYEDEHVYLHGYRAGVKLLNSGNNRVDMYFSHRFEGIPYDTIPPSLAGMAERAPGMDIGISAEHSAPWGTVFAEYLHDVAGASSGHELRLGYNYDYQRGNWYLRPHVAVSFRDAKLNNYYYGVRPEEVTAERRAYMPGWGINTQVGLYAAYQMTERWRLLAGIGATYWSKRVRNSPVVDDRIQYYRTLGVMYDFSPEHAIWPEPGSLIVKAMYGKSTDCNLLPIMRLGCTSTSTLDQTRIAALEIGRPFIRQLNGWPVDVVGYVGLLHHNENGFQQNFWQANAYMKMFYYGFPWDGYVRTRIGFGAGASYAQKVPYVEQRDQLLRGRNTSKLLNYLDPSIDISVGDLIGVREMKETYFGFGVSHRSGMFASSQLLRNVDGGSNFIYTYMEWKM